MFSQMIQKFTDTARLPMIFQSETAECALACLCMVSQSLGKQTSLLSLRKHYPVSLKGLTLKHLLAISQHLGMKGMAVSIDIDDLKRINSALILHWDGEHYVVLKGYKGNNFIIHDPARGVREISEKEMSNHFTGIAVSLANEESNDETIARLGVSQASAKLRDWTGSLSSFKPSFMQILLLSFTLELLNLLQPIYFRAVLDTGVKVADTAFIQEIGLLLFLIACFAGITSYLRDRLVIATGAELSQTVVHRLYSKVLSLSLPFFEKRPIGHLIERFNVTDELERYMVSNLPLAFLDGMVALVALGYLYYIAIPLGLSATVFLIAIFFETNI
jgi:ATP-binding cassette subfamily B protein RaxB